MELPPKSLENSKIFSDFKEDVSRELSTLEDRVDNATSYGTYRTLDELKDAPADVNRAYTLVTPSGRVQYSYVKGNFAGKEDDVYYVKMKNISSSTGVLVKQSGKSLGFLAEGSNAVPRELEEKSRETVSVSDYGAKGDGVTDDTLAFNKAIGTGRKVTVPYTDAGYLVNNINVISNMHISGEKNGMSLAPCLIVKNDNGAAFYNNANDNVFHCTFENLACRASLGIRGTSFYSQSTQTFYSAYFTFRNIETYVNLKISYVGLWIFALWDRIRDGYLGSKFDVEHSFIVALAQSYGQTNQQNIIRIKDSMVFNAFGSQAAITASYGVLWKIDNTDFEALQTRAFVSYNLTKVRFEHCWFESITAPSLIYARLYPNTAAASTMSFEHCNFVLIGSAPVIIEVENLGLARFQHCSFQFVPENMRLTNTPRQVIADSTNDVSGGPGAETFMSGVAGPFSMAISTSFVDVKRFRGIGGLVTIVGYNTNGGSPASWTRRISGNVSETIGTDYDPSGLGAVFKISDGFLQMKVTKDSAVITVE